MNIFLDVFRSMLWLFASCTLSILDILYDLFRSIIGLRITDSPFATQLFSAIAGVTLVFVLYRIFKMYFKTVLDEGYALSFSGLKMMWRLFFATLTLALAPTIYTYTMSTVQQWVTTDIPAIISTLDSGISVNGGEDFKLSDVIIRGGFTDNGMTDEQKAEIFNSMKNDTLLEMDINKKVDGKYVFYKDTYSIILTLLIAMMSLYCMLLISMGFTSRSLTIVFKFMLGPWFISGLIESDDKGFSAWLKHLSADVISNIFQIIMFYSVIILVQQESLYEGISGISSFLVRPIMMWFGLMFVIQGPTGITALIGGDGMGAVSAIQGLQQASQTVGIGGQVAGAVMTAGAVGVVAAGRAAGANSGVLGGQAGSRGQSYTDRRPLFGINEGSSGGGSQGGEGAAGGSQGEQSSQNGQTNNPAGGNNTSPQNENQASTNGNSNVAGGSEAMDSSSGTNQGATGGNDMQDTGANTNGSNQSDSEGKSYMLNGEMQYEPAGNTENTSNSSMAFNKLQQKTQAFARAIYDASAERLKDNKRVQHFDSHTAAMYRNYKNRS